MYASLFVSERSVGPNGTGTVLKKNQLLSGFMHLGCQVGILRHTKRIVIWKLDFNVLSAT